MLAGHASGCWRSALGAGMPYNRKPPEIKINLKKFRQIRYYLPEQGKKVPANKGLFARTVPANNTLLSEHLFLIFLFSFFSLLYGMPAPSAERQHPEAWPASTYGHLKVSWSIMNYWLGQFNTLSASNFEVSAAITAKWLYHPYCAIQYVIIQTQYYEQYKNNQLL